MLYNEMYERACNLINLINWYMPINHQTACNNNMFTNNLFRPCAIFWFQCVTWPTFYDIQLGSTDWGENVTSSVFVILSFRSNARVKALFGQHESFPVPRKLFIALQNANHSAKSINLEIRKCWHAECFHFSSSCKNIYKSCCHGIASR